MAEWWTNYPWRVIQTNMREIDMADLDARQFVKDLQGFHCNAVMLNAAGILASYPTKLAYHAPNAYLTGDSLKQLVDLCHENDIKAIARTDFSKIRREVYDVHPDWAYRTPDGEIVDNNGSISACITAGFQGQYMDEILKELLAEIPFDGVYCNMGGFMTVDYNCKFYGPCHCESCQTKFREQFGFDIPEKDFPFASLTDPAVMAYQKFKAGIVRQQKERVTQLIHRINPKVAFCSVDYLRQESNTEYGRGLPHWQYSASSNVRAMRGMGKEATNASVDFIGFSMRHVAVTPALQELRLWQTIANFGGPDYFIMGRLDNQSDTSAHESVKRVFGFAQEHEQLLYGVTSCAKVLLVRESYNIPIPEERGWIRVLTEQHVPFDEVLSAGLPEIDLSKYDIVILPEKSRLNNGLHSKLNGYVKSGGCILVVGKPPMDAGSPLECLGLTLVQVLDENALGATLKIRTEDRAVFPGMENRSFVPVGKSYLQTAVGEKASKYLQLLPPQRFGPPEVCYPIEEPTEYYGISVHPYGKGKGVFIPWNPATSYYQEGYDVWSLFLEDVLCSICRAQPLSKQLTPMVEVTHGKKGDFELLHFVNGTGHFGTSFFEPVTLYNQTVEIPWDGSLAVCESLYTPDNVAVRVENGKLQITVNELGFYECIVIKKQS